MVRAFLRLQSLCVLILLSGFGVVPGYSEEPVASPTSTTLKSSDPDAALAAFKNRKEVIRNNAEWMIDDLASMHSSLMFWMEEEKKFPTDDMYFQGREAYWKLIQAMERAKILSKQMEDVLDKVPEKGKYSIFNNYYYYRAMSESVPEKKIEWLRKGLGSLKKDDRRAGLPFKLQLSFVLIEKGELQEGSHVLSEAIAESVIYWLSLRERYEQDGNNMPERFIQHICALSPDFADVLVLAKKAGVSEESIWKSVIERVEREKGKNSNSRKATEEAQSAFSMLEKQGLSFLERDRNIGAFAMNIYHPGINPKTVDYLRMLSGGVEHVEQKPYVEKVIPDDDLHVTFNSPSGEKTLIPLREGFSLIEMVWIPGGKFRMGSEASEPGRNDNEGPVREVEVRGFWMSKYEITQEQFCTVMGEERNPSKFKAPKNPVESLSDYDALSFCTRLSNTVKRAYTLPDEVQWEYACRAGTTSAYSLGQNLSPDSANFRAVNQEKVEHSTKFVGSYAPNAFGLYDMHGNVAEWTETRYNFYPGHRDRIDFATKPYIKSNPENQIWSRKVVRGGSWDSLPEECRSASRVGVNGGSGSDRIGFRIVRNY
jgi:formylglycine-generating enzyme required for sulfatase activity